MFLLNRDKKCKIINNIVRIIMPKMFLVKIYRSIHSQMFFKKGVLENFANFTEKHLCLSLFSMKLQANFIKKRFQHWSFPVKFPKF